ncbi:MAG: HAD family hydrolase [Lachnospiraceae bacterium]|nr:HAD family hydrolase [Lachnospiraceae bacterium]
MRIGILSNVNMNMVVRMLGRSQEVYQTEGYGNELGILLNPQSSLWDFRPQMLFLIEDLMELLGHDIEPDNAKGQIARWFSSFEQTLKPDCIYYVSDAYLWGVELAAVADGGCKSALEQLWQQALEQCVGSHPNVRILPYRSMIEGLGEKNAFSLKTWYMGKILHSTQAQQAICQEIATKVALESRVPKKVLLLDLDNTLWGGLAGEADHTPITLSEDHSGLAYKNLQRVILQLQKQGVLLGIVSKNNRADAMKMIAEHPHMVLRPEHFAITKINWEPKNENIEAIARELNLGLDSMVFLDDNPSERQLVQNMLPQVTVLDFPEHPEDLAPMMVQAYKDYFQKSTLTAEDLEKTAQYQANAKREELKSAATDFEGYLKSLEICLIREDAVEHLERMTQLVNKTNQFNLTTCRYTQTQMQQTLEDTEKQVFLYRVEDCFGDSGIVAVVVVDCGGETPVVEEFAMSCRVMGKKIETAIVEDVEQTLLSQGYEALLGLYIPTEKNQPVAKLWEQLGYERLEDEGPIQRYRIVLANGPERVYFVQKK